MTELFDIKARYPGGKVVEHDIVFGHLLCVLAIVFRFGWICMYREEGFAKRVSLATLLPF